MLPALDMTSDRQLTRPHLPALLFIFFAASEVLRPTLVARTLQGYHATNAGLADTFRGITSTEFIYFKKRKLFSERKSTI
jgi:hypothetical protein